MTTLTAWQQNHEEEVQVDEGESRPSPHFSWAPAQIKVWEEEEKYLNDSSEQTKNLILHFFFRYLTVFDFFEKKNCSW